MSTKLGERIGYKKRILHVTRKGKTYLDLVEVGEERIRDLQKMVRILRIEG